MTAITLNDIQSGYNVHKVNDNFTILEDNINNDVLHTAGGGNTMNQDIDMDGNSIFNLTTDPNNSQSAVSVQYLREFTGVAEGLDERVDRLEVLSTDRIVIDLLGALTYNLTVTEALHTSISFLNPHSSGSTLVTIPNAPEMPVRFYVNNDGPYDLEFVGVTGTPLVIKPGTTPLFKYLPTGEVYQSYVFSQPYEGSVVQSSLETSLQELLTEVQVGTPTNTMVVAGDSMQDVVWKLQGQTLAARSIAIINTGSGSTYTMTTEESAAALWTFVGGTADCVVTPVINTLTQGVKHISTLFSDFDITIGGVKFNKTAYGPQTAFMSEATGFFLIPLNDSAANSRVFEQDQDSYFLADLINGTYNYFTNASAVTLTVQPDATAAIPDNAEYQIEARGAGGLTIVAGSGVTIIPPKGGSLILAQGDFVKIKRTNLDEFKLIGTTV